MSNTLCPAADHLEPTGRFTVRTERRANAPGCWDSTLVTVLDRGVPCGEFLRNYGGSGPFAPFRIGEEWFALYSPDYTATRIMRLPSCQDIGGEEPDTFGFCPIELFVPAYRLHSFDIEQGWRAGEQVAPYVERRSQAVWPDQLRCGIAEVERRIAAEAPLPGRRIPGEMLFNHALSDWRWCPFGFVAGCIWGDDSSWKIQFIDLAQAAEGVLRREERFGYIELPNRLSLPEAIDMARWEPDGGNDWVGVTHTALHNLRTGEAD